MTLFELEEKAEEIKKNGFRFVRSFMAVGFVGRDCSHISEYLTGHGNTITEVKEFHHENTKFFAGDFPHFHLVKIYEHIK